jgi:hypothetical protein
MLPNGTINRERYPAFARLAEHTTWFRNASSPHQHTDDAIPAIATGSLVDEGDLPTYQSLPRNLLALMATSVPVIRYEPVTDLCPPSACLRRASEPLRQAIEDTVVVYGHRVLPESLRDGLPAIDEAWGSFGGTVDDGAEGIGPLPEEGDHLARWHRTGDDEKAAVTQARRLVEYGVGIDGTPSLQFVHIVLPHVPWFATPWGTQLMRPMPSWHDDPDDPLSRSSALLRYQRHSLQTGAADVALGEVLDHLEASPAWDRTTLVVTADHGTGTVWPDVKRDPTPANEDEVFRVPLFLKVPGQREAAVVDEVAMTIDVLPTLIDVLDIETDWELDGHSLLDGSARTTDPVVSPGLDPLFGIVRQHARDFPHGWDWAALAAVGEHGGLVGLRVGELEVGEESELEWRLDNGEALAGLPVGDRVPQILTGSVEGSGDATPPELVVVANGTIAGVTAGYERGSGTWDFFSVLGPYLVDGANRVEAFEVESSGGEVVLHRVRRR